MRAAESIVWAGGEHNFRLGIGELRAIEQKANAGCSVVFMRLVGMQWHVDDVLNPIRLGLIGGGMKEDEAKRVIEAATDTASLYALSIVAADVLRRFISFDGDDNPGEAPAGEAKSQTRSQTEEPVGPITTKPAAPLDSAPEKSTT